MARERTGGLQATGNVDGMHGVAALAGSAAVPCPPLGGQRCRLPATSRQIAVRARRSVRVDTQGIRPAARSSHRGGPYPCPTLRVFSFPPAIRAQISTGVDNCSCPKVGGRTPTTTVICRIAGRRSPREGRCDHRPHKAGISAGAGCAASSADRARARRARQGTLHDARRATGAGLWCPSDRTTCQEATLVSCVSMAYRPAHCDRASSRIRMDSTIDGRGRLGISAASAAFATPGRFPAACHRRTRGKRTGQPSAPS